MTTSPLFLKRIAVLTGLALGAFALSAVAGWTDAPASPPNNNVDAPLNVGSLWQTKAVTSGSGGIGIGTGATQLAHGVLNVIGGAVIDNLVTNGQTITGNLALTSGAPAAGKVLTSDANGNAIWKTPTSGAFPPINGSVIWTESFKGPRQESAKIDCGAVTGVGYCTADQFGYITTMGCNGGNSMLDYVFQTTHPAGDDWTYVYHKGFCMSAPF